MVRPNRYLLTSASMASAAVVALGCGDSGDETTAPDSRDRAEHSEPAEAGDRPTVAPASVEGIDPRSPRPTVIASGETARGEPFEMVVYGTSEGPCMSVLLPEERSIGGGGTCGKGILSWPHAPVQFAGSSSSGQNVVYVHGLVAPEVRSVQLSFELAEETETIDAVTEQVSPELVRKAGGEEPVGVFIAFLPKGVASEADVTATAYDSDGEPLGTATGVDFERVPPAP